MMEQTLSHPRPDARARVPKAQATSTFHMPADLVSDCVVTEFPPLKPQAKCPDNANLEKWRKEILASRRLHMSKFDPS